ncbi:MAG: iron-sulfur cluster biosynthesis family protein [Thermoanaerobaculia bacterium]
MAASIAIDPAAAPRLEEELAGRILRIGFTTGCGGSGYRLGSADGPEEGDEVLTVGNITIALDAMAADKLDGAVIQWDEESDGYTIDHPNAVMTAWCG